MTNEAQRIFSEGPEGSTLRCRTCGLWKPTRRFANPSVCKACTPETVTTCTRCKQQIETAEGYLVAGEDGLQFTDAPDPRVTPYDEVMHFVCPA